MYSMLQSSIPGKAHVLYKVKDSHSVADRREEMGAIGAVEQVALAVDSAKQVRELGRSS